MDLWILIIYEAREDPMAAAETQRHPILVPTLYVCIQSWDSEELNFTNDCLWFPRMQLGNTLPAYPATSLYGLPLLSPRRADVCLFNPRLKIREHC